MKLIACPVCHTQYDVSQIVAEHFTCRCGEELENRSLRPVDATVARCASCGAQVSEDTEQCSYCGSTIERDPGKLSLICPECFARNAEESRFCTACGVAFSPEPLQVDGRELPCPGCEARMPPTQVAGIPVNECPSCHGLWVPGDHFDRLVARAADARRERGPTAEAPRVAGGNPLSRPLRYRRCPECDEFMLRVNYKRSSGVILDECRSHGTWLDADELEEIAGFILTGGHTSAALDTEHENARREATAAYARARVEAARASVGAGSHGGVFGGLGDHHHGGGLLRILFDILT